MDGLLGIVKSINGVLWGPPMLILLMGTGIYLTFILRGVQIRKLGAAFKQTFGGIFDKSNSEDGVSSFASLATAIAAQVGTGNLAGVATAIAAGGPGAIFWMWVSGFFGMATIFSEAVVSQQYTVVEGGQKLGGPAYYIKGAMKNKALGNFLSVFFAVAIILALGLMGSVVQANSIAAAANTAFGVPKIAVGIFVSILVLLIVVGGVKRITAMAEMIVPIMALFYIVGSLIIIFGNFSHIGSAFGSIFSSAFSPAAAAGGFAGAAVKAAIQKGIARGLFSNEAGMGSTPHAHALANVDHPVQQGLVATIGVIIDTGVICTMTALVILTSGVLETGLDGAELTQAAFTSGFGAFGSIFIAICLFFFALTTIIGWYFFGETNVRYLFKEKGLIPYRVIVAILLVVGSTLKVELVWEMADMFNALMVIPNLIGLLALSGLVVKILKDYENNFSKNLPCEYGKKKSK
ncbi:MAG: alanine/glycine:cation symporter family protein [Lachnospirales bacterium]